MKAVYKGFNITVPYTILQVEALHMISELGTHMQLALTVLIEEEKIDEYLHQDVKGKSIQFTKSQEEGEDILFIGKITQVQVVYRRQLAFLNITALSYSHDLDIKRRQEAFFDLESTYKSIFKKVLSKYPTSDFQDLISKGKVIKDLLVQYEETDWAFLKRLATHFNATIIADAKADRPRVYLGFPELKKEIILDRKYYSIISEIELCEKIKVANEKDVMVQNFVGWQVESYDYIAVGTELKYAGQTVRVAKVVLNEKKQELIFTYTLKFEKGLQTIYQINKKLQGVSLEAIVKKRRNNEAKLHFCMNESYEDKAGNKWFSYAREIGNFYIMPVEESKVHVTFLTGDEKDTTITNCIRIATPADKYYSKIADPNQKSYSTVDGQELLMNKDQLQIAQDDAKSISINLQKDGNVTITGKNITIEAKGNIQIGLKTPPPAPQKYLKPKTITLSAGNEVTITKCSVNGINTLHAIQLNEEGHIKGNLKAGE